jgi:WD40 repeat protein/serine/threonine protein kinase
MATDSSDRLVLLNRLAEEFAQRYRNGERPSLQEYMERHPELADDIRECFQALAEVEQVRQDRRQAQELPARGPLPPLERLGDFRIVREVGRGGMGVVYEAEQVSLGRRVALKLLPHQLPDARAKQRFEREARAAARLHHTNIVPVFGVGEHDGLSYYVMQFIQGLGLDEVLRELKRLQPGARGGVGELRASRNDVAAADVARSLLTGQFAPVAAPEATVDHAPDGVATENPPEAGRLSDTFALSASSAVLPGAGPGKKQSTYWQSVARIGVQVADALEHAHKQGVLHRDVKPSNLLLDRQGTVWVTDFGLAKADDQQDLTHTGDVLGTLRYMPPEAFDGKADARGDVYSVGLTLYEMLALRPAFDEPDRNKLIKQVTTAEPPRLEQLNPAVPRDLATVVGKAIERDPGRRYQTAGELTADLQRFLDDVPIRARPVGPWERWLRWARRRPAVAGLLAVCLVAILGLTVGGWWYNAQLYAANQDAENRRREAERERQQAVTNLYHSLVGEAQAIRRARESGYRVEAWKRLHQALHLETPDRDVLQLRQEAAASLGDFAGLEAKATWTDFPADVLAIALHPRGTVLALGLRDGTVQVRDLATGAETARFRAHPALVRSLAFGPDGTLFSSDDHPATVKVWVMNREGHWECTRTLTREPGMTGGTPRLAVSPDGQQIAAGSWQGPAVPVWEVADGARAAPFRGDGRTSPQEVAFSPDGRLLAAGFNARGSIAGPHGIWVWETAGRQLKHTLSPELGGLHQIQFSPDGQLLACACGEGVALYDTVRFEKGLFVRGDNPGGVSFSPDGRLLAVAASHAWLVRLWDITTNREVARLRHPALVAYLAYSADGRLLVAASERAVRVWNVAGTGEKLVLAGHGAGIPGVAFSPDGQRLATAGGDYRVKIWDPATGQLLRELPAFGYRAQAVAFSPDGRFLATGDWAGGLQVWDAASGQRVTALETGLRLLFSVAFSPDGRYFAACGALDWGGEGSKGAVLLWRIVPDRAAAAGNRLELQPLPRLSHSAAYCQAFTADSSILAWVEHGHTLHLWDLAASRRLPPPVPRVAGWVHALAPAGPGKRLTFGAVTGDTEVWDLGAGRKLFSLAGETLLKRTGLDIGTNIAVSPDGTRFASIGSRDTVWDLERRQLLVALPESRVARWCLALSPNKDLLAVGASDGGLEIWNLPRIRAQLAAIGLGW